MRKGRRGKGALRGARAQRRQRRKNGREIRSEIRIGRVILGPSLVFSLLFDELHVPLARLPPPPAREYLLLFSQTAGRGSGDGPARKTGLWNTFRFSRAALRPALFNHSSPNTESLNQGPAVFSTRLMYRRKSGLSAKPPGTGAHLASGSHSVIA